MRATGQYYKHLVSTSNVVEIRFKEPQKGILAYADVISISAVQS